MKRILIISAFIGLLAPAFSFAEFDLFSPSTWRLPDISAPEMPDWLHPTRVTIAPSYRYGSVDGFVQIPAGGQPGTSTLRRPTFEELNLDTASFFDLTVGAHWHDFGAYGRYRYLRPSDSAVLTRPVVTHGVTITAGTGVAAEVKMDTYAVGMKYDFHWNGMIIAPKFEYDLLDFSYDFNTTAGVTSRRSFTKSTFRLGLDVVYPLDIKSNVIVTGMFSIPSATQLEMYDVMAVYNYRLIQNDNMTLDVFGGGGASYIDFEDKQTLPNHVRATIPQLVAGVSLSF